MTRATTAQRNYLKYNMHTLSSEQYAFIEDELDVSRACDLISLLKSIPPGNHPLLMESAYSMLQAYMRQSNVKAEVN